MTKKGGIAITTIAVLFITIISIMLLLALFGMRLPGFAKEIYCKTIYVVFQSSYEDDSQVDAYCKRKMHLSVSMIDRQEGFLYDFSDGSQVKRLIQDPAGPAVVNIIVPNSTIINATLLVKPNQIDSIDIIFNPGGYVSSTGNLPADTPYLLEFWDELNYSLVNCNTDPCNIQLSIDFTGQLKVYNLNISFEKCFVKNELVASMLACWKKARFGKYNKNIMCDEIRLSEKCPVVPLTKTDITTLMADKGLDEVLHPNEIDWRLNTMNHDTNVLVEYDSNSRIIRVS